MAHDSELVPPTETELQEADRQWRSNRVAEAERWMVRHALTELGTGGWEALHQLAQRKWDEAEGDRQLLLSRLNWTIGYCLAATAAGTRLDGAGVSGWLAAPGGLLLLLGAASALLGSRTRQLNTLPGIPDQFDQLRWLEGESQQALLACSLHVATERLRADLDTPVRRLKAAHTLALVGTFLLFASAVTGALLPASEAADAPRSVGAAAAWPEAASEAGPVPAAAADSPEARR